MRSMPSPKPQLELVDIVAACQTGQGRQLEAAWDKLARIVLPWLKMRAVAEIANAQHGRNQQLAEALAGRQPTLPKLCILLINDWQFC